MSLKSLTAFDIEFFLYTNCTFLLFFAAISSPSRLLQLPTGTLVQITLSQLSMAFKAFWKVFLLPFHERLPYFSSQ
jgi:hypothetical protein